MRMRWMSGVVLAVVSLCGVEAVHATPLAVPVRAMFGQGKLVKFALRNDSGAPLKLQCGDQTMTVENGKSVPLALPSGSKVVTMEATAKLPAGSVVAQATAEIAGATIVVH